MAVLHCSNTLMAQLDALHEPEAIPATPPGRLGDWCATVFSLEDRRAALFMSQRTLLSFIILEGKRFDMEAIARILWGGLAQVLEMEGYKKRDVEEIVESYSEIVLAKTASASRTSQMNSLIRDYRHLVMSFGGLKRCDVGVVIHEINQRPRKALDWATPQEVTHELVNSKTG